MVVEVEEATVVEPIVVDGAEVVEAIAVVVGAGVVVEEV